VAERKNASNRECGERKADDQALPSATVQELHAGDALNRHSFRA
jgi:hypothetical protein